MAESMGKMPFGAHKDKDIEDVPDHYLKWFIGEGDIRLKHKELCANIRKELLYREKFDLHIKE